MKQRPDYCPDDIDDSKDDPCPACGATPSGRDAVNGACQARFNGPAPRPLVKLVLIDKRTGKVV